MRIIVHCGSSKNGSTALQSALFRNGSVLASQGVAVMCNHWTAPSQVSSGHFSVDELNIGVLSTFENRKDSLYEFVSFERVYELYKDIRKYNRKLELRLLADKLILAFERCRLAGFRIVIVSAEAFETSLCLEDVYFRRFLDILGGRYTVRLVYYQPDPARYVLSSWLEWGWIGKIDFLDWLKGFRYRTTAAIFFQGNSTGVQYLANLICLPSWRDYWVGSTSFLFSVITDSVDIVKHFFGSVLLTKGIEFDFLLDEQNRNVGWPPRYIYVYPLLFDFFAGDPKKFGAFRALFRTHRSMASLGDAEGPGPQRLLDLTGLLLTHWVGEVTILSEQCDEVVARALEEIELVFKAPKMMEVCEVIRILSDTLYFYHQEKYGESIEQ